MNRTRLGGGGGGASPGGPSSPVTSSPVAPPPELPHAAAVRIAPTINILIMRRTLAQNLARWVVISCGGCTPAVQLSAQPRGRCRGVDRGDRRLDRVVELSRGARE